MTINGRRKGHNWEREVVQFFLPMDPSARRNASEAQNKDENQKKDVLLDNLPLAVQCKSSGVWKGWDALEDLKRFEGKLLQVAFVKQTGRSNKRRECVVLTLEGFKQLLEAYCERNRSQNPVRVRPKACFQK